MAGGAGGQLGGEGQANYMMNGPGAGGQFTQAQTQNPQWLKGLQLGQQMMQAQQQQPPQAPQRPMMGGAGMPGGMPQQSVVPGAVPQMPMQPGMMGGGMGMGHGGGQGAPGGINPQLLQMLMRSRQQ